MQKLAKCDRETKFVNAAGKGDAKRLAQCSIVKSLQKIKAAASAKHNKVKHN